MPQVRQRLTAPASHQQVNALHSLFALYAPLFPGGCYPPQPEATREGRELENHQLQLPLLDQPKQQTDERAARLAWASGVVGRTITSFAELRSDEAALLIETMKKALGQETRPAIRRKRPDRDTAQLYGTAGRRRSSSKEIRLVDEPTLLLIVKLCEQLAWNEQRLDGFLRGSTSPVRSGVIRTLDEANRVIWALRGMLRRKEKQEEKF